MEKKEISEIAIECIENYFRIVDDRDIKKEAVRKKSEAENEKKKYWKNVRMTAYAWTAVIVVAMYGIYKFELLDMIKYFARW